MDPYDRNVHLVIPRRHDLEIHVSTIIVDEKEYADVREFVPSLQQYGRGILIPARSVGEVVSGLQEVQHGLNTD